MSLKNLQVKFQLQEAISQAVKKAVNLDINPKDIFLEHPEVSEFGDYATNIVMTIFANIKNKKAPARNRYAQSVAGGKSKNTEQNVKLIEYKKPLDLAEAIVKELSLNISISQYLNICCVAAPGFINISLKPEFLLQETQKVLELKDGYGNNTSSKIKKIMVEFAHPNTHKAFHIGHLRNIINGEAIVRILEANSHKVIRANYQGDVGMHIAKCLFGILKSTKYQVPSTKLKTTKQKVEFLAKAYVEGNKAYEENEQAKKEILEINKKIYNQSDEQINKLWSETRQWSLDYFEAIYRRVYSYFDRYYFESEVYKKAKEIVLDGVKRGIFSKSKGAIIFPGSKYGLHDRVFITGQGNPTYEAKDMELARLQFFEHQPDLIIHNVGPEQASYMKVIFKALEMLFPYTKDKEYHLMYGWVKLKKAKMSSRSGNVVLGEWLLDETKAKIKNSFPNIDDKTLEMISIGAIKYSFLKVSPPSEVAFDFEESVSLEGNSGPYLQYTYARCRSVLAKASLEIAKLPNCHIAKLNKEELSLLRTIYKFPEVVQLAGEQYSPNTICNFLYDLAQKYNTFYNKHRILEDRELKTEDREEITEIGKQKTDDRSNFRLLLTQATSQILKNGLYLLGIKCPHKM